LIIGREITTRPSLSCAADAEKLHINETAGVLALVHVATKFVLWLVAVTLTGDLSKNAASVVNTIETSPVDEETAEISSNTMRQTVSTPADRDAGRTDARRTDAAVGDVESKRTCDSERRPVGKSTPIATSCGA
jgi:hypothetical protein